MTHRVLVSCMRNKTSFAGDSLDSADEAHYRGKRKHVELKPEAGRSDCGSASASPRLRKLEQKRGRRRRGGRSPVVYLLRLLDSEVLPFSAVPESTACPLRARPPHSLVASYLTSSSLLRFCFSASSRFFSASPSSPSIPSRQRG